jgi:hypothetical protein
MLKQTVTYKDFNDQEQTEVLYFNISKPEMVDFLPMLPRLVAMQQIIEGPDRELTNTEIKEMLDIIRTFIAASYGVRSEDGKYFRKSPELFADFKDSGAYDAFLFSLFEDVQKGNKFLQEIMPKDLAEEAAAAAQSPVETITTGAELSAVEEEVPAWVRENRRPTPKELQGMSPEQLRDAFRRQMSKE